jgi:hypothetical protein
MKSQLILGSVISLFVIALFFTSCQKDEFSSGNDDNLVTRSATSFSFSTNPANVGDSVMVTYDAENGADCGHIQLQVSGPDGNGWVTSGKPIEPDSGLATILFVPQEPGEYHVRAKYTRTGNPKNCDFESSGWVESEELLLVLGDTTAGDTTGGDTTGMDSTCEASFTGEAISCDSAREVVFTFVSDEDLDHIKIQGGLTNGTLEDAVITVAGADLDISQRTPGHSSNRVIKLEGSAEACVPIVITITWNTTNQGDVITGEWSATGGFVVDGLECQ